MMFLPSAPLSKFVFFTLIVTIVTSAQSAYTKSIGALRYSNLRSSDAIKTRRGGCAAFGHSCFGGHGKRMDSSADGNEADAYPTYIRAVFANDEPRVAGEIFRTDHPENNYESSVIVPLSSRLRDSEDYPKLFEFFRKWMANNHKRRELLAVRK